MDTKLLSETKEAVRKWKFGFEYTQIKREKFAGKLTLPAQVL